MDYEGGGAIAIPLVSGGLKDCLKGLGYALVGTATSIVTGRFISNIKAKYNKNKIRNPISNSMKRRIPNNKLTPPRKRGEPPRSKEDGNSIEIHHKNQNPEGPFLEMTRTEHRIGKNFKQNHPKLGERSLINRDEFAKQVRKYWKLEWDIGRWK